jgi:hypothetical protein
MSPPRSPRTYAMTSGKKRGIERANCEMMKKTTPEVMIPMKAGMDRRRVMMMIVRKSERNMAKRASLSSGIRTPMKKAEKKMMMRENCANRGKMFV